MAVLAIGAGIGVFAFSRQASGMTIKPFTRDLRSPGAGEIKAWSSPSLYLSAIRAAEQQNDIPSGLLERLLYQESRWRDDIISGQTISSAGAVGIAQIIPRWHPDVNPLDWQAAIPYAGRYLRQLRNQFGDWRKALAAYNWGPGNFARVNTALPAWLSQTPTETRNYVTEITRDVPV